MVRFARRFANDDARFTWLLAAVAAFLTLLYLVGVRRIVSSWNPDLRDYTMWYNHILQGGRWRSLNGSFASYNPPYIYVLSLASNLNGLLAPVHVLKVLNLPFVLASGALTFSICRALGCSQRRSLAAGWLMIVAPEIAANAFVWGQTDILETTFVLAFIRLLIAKRPGLAMAAAGVALSFKLQVIFLAPAILAFVLTHELPLWSLLAAPAGYLLMMLPAELAGRSYQALYGVYSAQTGAADRIFMGSANLYCLVAMGTGNGRVDAQHPLFLWMERMGILVAAVLSILLIRYLLRYRPFSSGGQKLIVVLAISALIEPFWLPKMHDRYFFIGDTLVLLLGFVMPRMLVPAILLQVSALMVYARYLIGFSASPRFYAFPTILIGIAIGLLFHELKTQSARSEAVASDTSSSLPSTESLAA